MVGGKSFKPSKSLDSGLTLYASFLAFTPYFFKVGPYLAKFEFKGFIWGCWAGRWVKKLLKTKDLSFAFHS